jgi:4-amino-4-deoxy-L-arabinose transferase-like glycosyltransferase
MVATGTTDRGAGTTPEIAWRPVALVAGASGALLLATSGRYGYHRDELYFLVAGRHLAWGYDDQPPFVPLLARSSSALFGGSLVGLRLSATLAVVAVTVLAALITREMGGGRLAQIVATACFAFAPVTLIAGHLLGTTVFDILFWALLTWLVARWVRTRDDRLWIVAGLVAGVGYLNKNLVAFLAVGLAVGLLIAGPREALRSRWPWLGAGLAVLIALPNVWWQARHGWPQLEMARVIREDADSGGWIGFLPWQLLLAGPLLAPVWIAGLWRLFRSPEARPFRLFGWAWVTLVVLFLVTGAKQYYLAGMLPVLLASGANATGGWLTRWSGQPPERGRTTVLAGAIALNAVASVALGLPVYPLNSFADSPQAAINYDARETVGWPRFAEAVARVYRSLPADEQRGAVVFTGSYGEAGAIERHGTALGLPTPYSAHNAYWRWGPPPQTAGPVIAVGYFGRAYLERYWASVTAAGRIDNGHRVENEEQGLTVWVCRAQRQPWRDIWPDLRHLS